MTKRLAISELTSDAGSTVDTDAIDQYVSQRIRRRRIMVALTQRRFAELIGITPQQIFKYEKGTDRIYSARLYQIAQILEVEISYFFEDITDPGGATRKLLPQRRMLLHLARDVISLKNPQHREAVCRLARALCHRD